MLRMARRGITPRNCGVCGEANSACKGGHEQLVGGISFGRGVLSKKAEEAHVASGGTVHGPSMLAMSEAPSQILVPDDFERGVIGKRRRSGAPEVIIEEEASDAVAEKSGTGQQGAGRRRSGTTRKKRTQGASAAG